MQQKSVDQRIGGLAMRQHGVFSREQAEQCGATKRHIYRRVDPGRWERMYPGVYRIAGAPNTWRQALSAACLAWGSGAVVSHHSAAALWRMPGFETRAIELTAPLGRRRSDAGIHVHRSALPGVDITSIDAIPVTAAARTLFDLAAVAPRDSVEDALDDALRRGLVTLPLLRWRLGDLARSGRGGITTMRDLLGARGRSVRVPDSVFETRLARLLTSAGMNPVIQHPIREAGHVVAVVDLAFPDRRIAIEADGYRWHSGRTRWESDLARRNALTRLGWRMIHVTWTDLHARPADVIRSIEQVLDQCITVSPSQGSISAARQPRAAARQPRNIEKGAG